MVKEWDISERTFDFALRIINLYTYLEKKSGAARILGQQILRSGTSVGANIEEAQGAQSRADFISKYSIARKEARETRYWLRLLVVSKTISGLKTKELLQEIEELIKIITTIILRSKENQI
ncbi:MAG: four helix bundle protein [bacterium]